MTQTIPDLWPDSIKTSVLKPLVILKNQALKLTEKTAGILLGDVKTSKIVDEGEGVTRILHTLYVVVPNMENYRHQLLDASHLASVVYPVDVVSGYLPDDEPVGHPIGHYQAVNQADFYAAIGSVFQSQGVVSLLESLIAQVNEKQYDET